MKNRMYIGTLFLAMLVQVSVYAQMSGNPVGSQGAGEWTIGASASTLKHMIGTTTTHSQRLVLKSAWGLSNWVDFFVLAGGVQLNAESASSGIEDFEGKFKPGIGAGLKLSLMDENVSGFGLWVDGHAFRFTSRGSYDQAQIISGTAYTREYHLYYDWREFQGNVGITIPIKRVKFYAAGTAFNIWRKDQKNEYLVDTNASQQSLGESNDEYKSGLWTGGLLGLEIELPQRYSLSVEFLGYNKKNYQIMFGISQIGMNR